MVQSMSRSFPREVWDDCSIPHPDDEREAGLASNTEVQEMVVPRKVYIKCEPETEASAEALMEERQMAALAKESGWSVLDVEEIRDYFLEHSTDGKVCLGSQTFEQLLVRLYRDDK